MPPDDITRTILETQGLAEVGLYVQAWEVIETLPPVSRLSEDVIAVRLMVCTGLKRWEMGRTLARLITAEHSLASRQAAGEFLLAYAYFLHASGKSEVAFSCLECLSGLWPEGREKALQSEVMRMEWT